MTKIKLLCFALLLFSSPTWATWTDFDGTDTRYEATDTAFDVTVLSAGCWIVRDGAGEATSEYLFEKDNTIWILVYDASFTGFEFRIFEPATDGRWRADFTPTTGQSYHIAATYDGASTTNDATIYIDGIAQSLELDTNPDTTMTGGTGQLTIGNNNSGVRTPDMRIGECFIYNRVLAANEVKHIKNCGPLSVPNGLVGYWPLGLFAGRDYAGNGRDLTETLGTGAASATGPPLSYPQGAKCE